MTTDINHESFFNEILSAAGLSPKVKVDTFTSLPAMMEDAFARFADRPLFTSLGLTLTFADVDRLSANFAAWLQNHTSLKPGDRVAVQMPNLVQYPVVVIGALRAGMVVVNTNPLYSEREIVHQFNDSGARLLIVQANVAATAAKVIAKTPVEQVVVTELADLHGLFKRLLINGVAKYIKKAVPPFEFPNSCKLNHALSLGSKHTYAPVPRTADDLAMLQYTGGTTGVAKGAMLSHGNIVANIMQSDAMFSTHELDEDETVIVQPLPVYHIYAYMTTVYSMFRGHHMVFISNPRDLDSVVKIIDEYKPSFFCGLNTLFVALCNNESFRKLDFSKLKVTLSGGMALSPPVAENWKRITGCEVAEGYGLTETSPVVSSNPGNKKIIGTIGIPVPNTEIRIINDDGTLLPQGERGELCVRGPQVMMGYWQRKEATEEVISDGWLKTGDIALIREDGYLQIVDRKKDMIVVSGFNVYPNELEDVLYEHEDVVECAAIGVPDESSGEAVKMFVVSASGKLTVDDVRAFCRKSMTGYKVPKFVEFRDELPKSNVGKILRKELRPK